VTDKLTIACVNFKPYRGALVTGAAGKVQYVAMLEFEGGREIRDAFSAAVWRAYLATGPPLENGPHVGAGRSVNKTT
jgi:hypothetical protein